MTAALLLAGLTVYLPAQADADVVWHRAAARPAAAASLPDAPGPEWKAAQRQPAAGEATWEATPDVRLIQTSFLAPAAYETQAAPAVPPQAVTDPVSCGGCGCGDAGGCGSCGATCDCCCEPCCPCHTSLCDKIRSLFHHDRCCDQCTADCCDVIEQAAPAPCCCAPSCGQEACCGTCAAPCDCCEPCPTCRQKLCDKIRGLFHHKSCCDECACKCCDACAQDTSVPGTYHPGGIVGQEMATPASPLPSAAPLSPMPGSTTIQTPSVTGRLAPAPQRAAPPRAEPILTEPMPEVPMK